LGGPNASGYYKLMMMMMMMMMMIIAALSLKIISSTKDVCNKIIRDGLKVSRHGHVYGLAETKSYA
jgi:hypothetical protein